MKENYSRNDLILYPCLACRFECFCAVFRVFLRNFKRIRRLLQADPVKLPLSLPSSSPCTLRQGKLIVTLSFRADLKLSKCLDHFRHELQRFVRSTSMGIRLGHNKTHFWHQNQSPRSDSTAGRRRGTPSGAHPNPGFS